MKPMSSGEGLLDLSWFSPCLLFIWLFLYYLKDKRVHSHDGILIEQVSSYASQVDQLILIVDTGWLMAHSFRVCIIYFIISLDL